MAAVTFSAPPQEAATPYANRHDSSDSSRVSADVLNEKVLSQKKRSSQGHGFTVDRSASPKRWKTFVNAFKHLYTLTPREVDAFMDSYQIYNLDWADEDSMIAALGPDYQRRVGDCLRAYYGVISQLCSLGDVEKMYIPPLMDLRASVLDNQLLYEESVADILGPFGPDARILDLGCGRGRVAAHIARYAGVNVTGLNIDPSQIEQARSFNAEIGLDKNEFVIHDQNELPLPFADASFDGFYEIQALSLCRDLPALFHEIYRVLRPGAKFCLMDWVSLPPYDPENEHHASLMRRVKPLIGAVGTPTPTSFEAALKDAGFTVQISDNPSLNDLQAPLIDKVDVYFRALRKAIHGGVRVRALPPHFKTLMDRLCLDGQAFVEMDRERLVTTTYRIVAQKPAA